MGLFCIPMLVGTYLCDGSHMKRYSIPTPRAVKTLGQYKLPREIHVISILMVRR